MDNSKFNGKQSMQDILANSKKVSRPMAPEDGADDSIKPIECIVSITTQQGQVISFPFRGIACPIMFVKNKGILANLMSVSLQKNPNTKIYETILSYAEMPTVVVELELGE